MQFLRRKKALFFTCMVASLLLLFSFHHALICFGVKSFLASRLPNGKALFFSYETMVWKGGDLLFQGVSLKREAAKKSEGFDAQIDTITLSFSAEFFPLKMSPQVSFKSPEVVLTPAYLPEEKNKKKLYKIFHKNLFKQAVVIEKGVFYFGTRETRPTYFSFKNNLQNKKGFLALSHTLEELEISGISAELFKEGRSLLFDLTLKDLSMPWLFDLTRFFSKSGKSEYLVRKGVAGGQLLSQINPNGEVSVAHYDVKLKDVNVQHIKSQVEIGAEELIYTKKRNPLDQPILGEVLQGEVKRAFIRLAGEDESHFVCAEMSGEINLTEEKELLIDCFGVLLQEDSKTPFNILGDGLFLGKAKGKIGLNVNIFPKEREAARLRFSGESNQSGQAAFFVDFSEVHAQELTFFKRFLDPFFSTFNPFTIGSGRFFGKAAVSLEKNRLAKLECQAFEGLNAYIEKKEGTSAFFAKHFKGGGEIDFLASHYMRGTTFEFSISEGILSGLGEQRIEDVNVNFAIYDQYIKPSSFSGRYGDFEGKVSVEGLLSHLKCNLNGFLVPKDLLSFFEVENNNLFSEVDREIELDLSLKLKTFEKKLSLEGLCSVLQKKGERDQIEFGCLLKPDVLTPDCLKWEWLLSKVDSGWFKAKNVSAFTFNLPLFLSGQHFFGEGKIDIEGNFDKNMLSLEFDPTSLTFVSPAVNVKGTTGTGHKAPRARMQLDCKEKIWYGEVSLKNSVVEEKSIGLVFDSFNGNLTLKGKTFSIKNIDASSDGVYFLGEMELDLDLEEVEEVGLKVKTSHIAGSVEAVSTFMRHFPKFNSLTLPITGSLISQRDEMTLHAILGKKSQVLLWDMTLRLYDGMYVFSPCVSCENLAATLLINEKSQKIDVANVTGDIILSGGGSSKSYDLNVPTFSINQKTGEGAYDVRVEAATHDIVRLAGTFSPIKEGTCVTLDPEKSHFFGAKGEVSTFFLNPQGTLLDLEMVADIPSLDLFKQLEFFSCAGLLPIPPGLLEEVHVLQSQGNVLINCCYHKKAQRLDFKAKSDDFTFGQYKLGVLNIEVKQRDNFLFLEEFKIGSLSLNATMEQIGPSWQVPIFDAFWKESEMRIRGGTYEESSKKLTLSIDRLQVLLTPFIEMLELPKEKGWSYVSGVVLGKGSLEVDLSNGLKHWDCTTNLTFKGENIGKGGLVLENPHPLKILFDSKKGLEIRHADFFLLHPSLSQVWTKCHFDQFKVSRSVCSGDRLTFTISPEMIHYLAETESIPYLKSEEKILSVLGTSFRWDNQIEAMFDFTSDETISVEGCVKEGYYWLGDHAWYLNDCHFSYLQQVFELSMNTMYNDIPFDLKAHLSFVPRFTTCITVQETLKEDRFHLDPLKIVTDWNDQEGFFIQAIEGHLCGISPSFYHRSRDSIADKMSLTGQVKINVPAFAKALPKQVQEVVNTFEVGQGYELSGDVTISKGSLDDILFTGYLRGKHFELLGSEMDTLLSEVKISPQMIELSHFKLSDVSGILSMDKMQIERFYNKNWHLTIPELLIQDFRPSLLKKIGERRGRIKPLTIRDLKFYNLRGTLGVKDTFTGKGELFFINTFKRDSNFLDIPLEIFGRLGLDMGLLVPVRGRIDFIMVDNRVYLTELFSSYSEGKRSQFFLSSDLPSYIDFEGNIHLNIRMKQSVLLKITEPFMLTVGGTLENPKYSLR